MPLPTCQCNAGQPTQTQLANIYCALWTLVDGGGVGGGLPDQAGHAGEFLTTDGTNPSWVPLAGGGDVVASGALTLNSLIIGGGGTTISASGVDISAVVTLTGSQSLSNKILTAPRFVDGGFIADSNGNEMLIFDTVAAAVNEVTIINASAGSGPTIRVSGSGTDVDLTILPKGSGSVLIAGALVLSSSAATAAVPFDAAAGLDVSGGSFTVAGVTTTGVTGTGNLVLSDSPTLTGTVVAATVGATTMNVTTFTVGGNAMTFPASAATIARTDAAQTFTGTQTLAEGASIRLDPVLSADGTFTGITIAGTAGAALAFGDLIYLAVADSRWELVDADSVTTAGAVWTGMCVLAAAADGDPTTVLLQGNIRADANFPALTVGAPVYAGTTPGDIQVAQPSGTDDVVQVVGFAITADSIYFNPSQVYITVV